MKLILYQTLDDKENPDVVEDEGPFPCSRADAWLGNGFYFWDTHIQLGHWWGRVCLERGVYKTGYIICQADASLDDTCWDLHGNGIHRLEFDNICKLLVEEKITTSEKLLVSHVIEYLKKKNIFSYNAVRALGMHSVSNRDKTVIKRIPFTNNDKVRYLDVYPPVQICLIKKTALSLKNYLIVHPEHYKIDKFA